MCVFDCFCVFVLSPKKWKEMNIIYSSVFFEKHPGVCFLSGQEFPSSWCYFDGIKKPLKGWCRRSWQPWLNGKIGWCHLVHLRQNKQFWIPKLQGVGCFISWRSSLRNDIVVHLELLHFSSCIYTFASGSISGNSIFLINYQFQLLLGWSIGHMGSFEKAGVKWSYKSPTMGECRISQLPGPPCSDDGGLSDVAVDVL